MEKLADLILAEMENMNCSIAYFADICGISESEVGKIVRRKKKDLNISTLLKIFENSSISATEAFEIECSEEFSVEDFVLTNGKEKYALKKV